MRFCSNCGKKIADNAVTCDHCGSSVAPILYTPVYQLDTNRSLIKLILLSFITLGIYGIVVLTKMSMDINTIASPHDGKKTMNFLLIFLICSWLSLGIVPLIWQHRICKRMGNELIRRGIGYNFGATTFWIWGILGLIIVVGPFIFMHKYLTAMNLLCADYNVRG